MADPLDKQLIEAVLASRPRRSRREVEEARLATMRPTKVAAAVESAVDGEDIPDLDDEDLDLEDEDAEPDTTVLSVEII
ncbi:MAG: hypothetical protein ACYC65_12845, partial [Candidatus Limnocylindrales bacterium]